MTLVTIAIAAGAVFVACFVLALAMQILGIPDPFSIPRHARSRKRLRHSATINYRERN